MRDPKANIDVQIWDWDLGRKDDFIAGEREEREQREERENLDVYVDVIHTL